MTPSGEITTVTCPRQNLLETALHPQVSASSALGILSNVKRQHDRRLAAFIYSSIQGNRQFCAAYAALRR